MPKKAKPRLKVRAFIGRMPGGYRVVLTSALYYKGKKVSSIQPTKWWGNSIPMIPLSKDNPDGCMTAITALHEHNAHLMAFDLMSDAAVYVHRVKKDLQKAVANWKPGEVPLPPVQSEKWPIDANQNVVMPFHAPPLVAGETYLAFANPSQQGAGKIVLASGYWYPEEYLTDMRVIVHSFDNTHQLWPVLGQPLNSPPLVPFQCYNYTDYSNLMQAYRIGGFWYAKEYLVANNIQISKAGGDYEGSF